MIFWKPLLSADLSYDQKCWHLSDHTHIIPTWNSGTLYTAYGRYNDNKLHLSPNEQTMKTYIEEIIVPYVKQKRAQLKTTLH